MADVWAGRTPARPAASMHVRAMKAESEGRWPEAVDALQELARLQPRVTQHRVRLAFALNKAGRPRAAVETYFAAAEAFVQEGFVEKGIACCHMARAICRHDERVDELLEKLRARRDLGRGGRPAAPPVMVPVRGGAVRPPPIPADAEPPLTGNTLELDLGGDASESLELDQGDGMPEELFEQIYCRPAKR